jgi:spermidine/putrescine transport system permease protein
MPERRWRARSLGQPVAAVLFEQTLVPDRLRLSLSRNTLKLDARRMPRLLLGAWTVLVFLFLYVPIALIVAYSFNRSQANVVWQGFTIKWYGRIASNEPLMTALWNSLVIAAATTGISCVLGTLAAWVLYRFRFPAARLIQGLIYFPVIVPEVIMGVSLLLLFSVLRIELGFLTVIVAHVTFCFPFVLIAVQARLQGLDPSLEEAAMDLGATPAGAFLRVILPFLMPSIVAGALMAFTLSIDEFVVTFFTAGAGSRTLPLEINGLIRSGLDPSVNALSALLVAATVVLVLAAGWARRLSLPRQGASAGRRAQRSALRSGRSQDGGRLPSQLT